MNPLPLLLLVPLIQDPGPGRGLAPGEVGKFLWRSAANQPTQYQARFQKQRQLDKKLEKAEKQARKAAGMHVPGRSPRQQVEMQMAITLSSSAEEVKGAYQTQMGKQSLGLKLLPPAEDGKAAPPLGNDRISAVWGHPRGKSKKPLALSRTAVDRSFSKSFKRRGDKEVEPGQFHGLFGDHLLPVLWNYPLPCWVEQLVNTVDLGGQAVIEGKTLIRDGTEFLPLGSRSTRVELQFTKAAASGFTMTYKMQVEQIVGMERDMQKERQDHFVWCFEIEGEASYSFSRQAFERIQEKVRASPKAPKPAQLRELRDEAFEGTIEITRGTGSLSGQGQGKKQRRR